ncbi:putative peripheral cytoplasmic membrane protein [Salmonella phage Solent]|nr:hypothetical protein CPTSergei_09 [Salmonella phage vB_SenS_Sergei]AXY86177.1 putative peripheral cytoplasmic membrane protein [Salmonella phage Solent]
MIHILLLHHFISLMGSLKTNNIVWDEPPQVTQQLPTKQPRRKTGVAQARHNARKRRNRK